MPPLTWSLAGLAAHALVTAGMPTSAGPSLLAREPQSLREMASTGRLVLPAIRSRDSSADNETGTVDVGSNWYIPVSIGTPPQSFLFLGDTGSVNCAVGSTLLPKEKQSNSPKYNPDKSSTAMQIEGYTYRSCFVSNFCSNGVVYQDVVTIGGLTIDDMEFGVQTNNTGPSNGPRSGTLGLDFDHHGMSTKPKRIPSWLQRIVPHLESGLFTVDFNPRTDTGTWEFGHIDDSRFEGSIGYAPIKENATEWVIKMSGLQLANGTVVEFDDWSVLVDTGTGDSRVPRDVADEYFSQIEGAVFSALQQTYTFPCSSSLVDFTFSFNGSMKTIPAGRLRKGPINGGSTCVSKLKTGEGGKPLIWGMSFIEQLFVVFDWDNNRLGFANKDF